MKTYRIEFSVRGTGVQLMKLNDEELERLREEDLDDAYYDFVDEREYDFTYENQFTLPCSDRFELSVYDADDNEIYQTDDASSIKNETYVDEWGEERRREFIGIEDGNYLLRISTIKGCYGEATFELPDDVDFNPDNLYYIENDHIDDELLDDSAYQMYEMYYQIGDEPNLEKDICIDFEPNGCEEEQYWDTYLMNVKEKNWWTNLQD